MNRPDEKLTIFDYRNYRSFLKAWHLQARTRSPANSLRAVARRAGFKSTNFLSLVIEGKRNLSEESLTKVAHAVNLNKQEEDFFRNLVFFNQAATHEEKNTYFKRIVQSKKFSELKPLEKRQYQYYSEWYHPVVRELVVARDYDDTPEWIAGRISPPITPAQVSRSIELLSELGLIARNGDGRWKQASPVIDTGAELSSVVVQNYHKSILGLTHHVLDRLSMRDREVSSLTLGLKRKEVPVLLNRIREFRKEILEKVTEETEPEEVILLNLQFFPVTVTKEVVS